MRQPYGIKIPGWNISTFIRLCILHKPTAHYICPSHSGCKAVVIVWDKVAFDLALNPVSVGSKSLTLFKAVLLHKFCVNSFPFANAASVNKHRGFANAKIPLLSPVSIIMSFIYLFFATF